MVGGRMGASVGGGADLVGVGSWPGAAGRVRSALGKEKEEGSRVRAGPGGTRARAEGLGRGAGVCVAA